MSELHNKVDRCPDAESHSCSEVNLRVAEGTFGEAEGNVLPLEKGGKHNMTRVKKNEDVQPQNETVQNAGNHLRTEGCDATGKLCDRGQYKDGEDNADTDVDVDVDASVSVADDADGVPTGHLKDPPAGTIGTVLLVVGSFSPPTTAHVRLLVAARDTMRETSFVSGGYLSPVSDAYGKPGLVSTRHRIAMCKIALQDVPWADVTSWEARHPAFTRTHVVVEHMLGALRRWREMSRFRVVVVCGADVRVEMTNPISWPPESAAALQRVASFAVKRRSHVPKEEDAPQTRLSSPRGSDGAVSTLDVDIGPWVGNLSSTVVR